MQPNVPSEYAEQCAVVQWWTLWARTKGLDERLLFSVPNGAYLAGDAKQSGIRSFRLQKAGMRKGVPDLFLAIPKPGVFAGMWIEMKRRKGGRIDPEQASMIALLRGQEFNVIVARGADEAIRAIEGYVG